MNILRSYALNIIEKLTITKIVMVRMFEVCSTNLTYTKSVHK